MKKTLSILLITTILILFISNSIYAFDSSVKIAVIDSGVSSNVIDKSNLTDGWNYVTNNSNTEDNIGHGTKISSLIVGTKSKKVEGVCGSAIIVPLVIVDKNSTGQEIGGNTSYLIQAIYDAVDKYKCQIINCSLSTFSYDSNLKNAIDYAYNKGVTIIASSGNLNGTTNYYSYPASFSNVISVASCSSVGNISPFSLVNEETNIIAIGEGLVVANPNGSTSLVEGTSYSAAIVSGCLATLLLKNPKISSKNALSILQNLCDTNIAGYKILNLSYIKNYLPFIDISNYDYFYSAVSWAYNSKITLGVDFDIFSPNTMCTRAEAITFLWRRLKNPSSNNHVPFTDVDSSSYYYEALKWAVENNITLGKTQNTFCPNDICTRGEIITMIYRCLGNKTLSNNIFTDVNSSDYFYDSVIWAKEYKITSGTDKEHFSPNISCKRCEIITFLYRTTQLENQ